MANIRQLASGHWQVQIRLKGRKVTETFLRHDHAREWATEAEGQIDQGHAPSGRRARRAKTFGTLIDLHIDDMKEVGKPPRRLKSATLEMLQRELGALKIAELDRERLIRFGRDRAKNGAGPVTLGTYIGAIKLVVTHAAAVHGVEITAEPVILARIALKRLGLIGKTRERPPARVSVDGRCCRSDAFSRIRASNHRLRDISCHGCSRRSTGRAEAARGHPLNRASRTPEAAPCEGAYCAEAPQSRPTIAAAGLPDNGSDRSHARSGPALRTSPNG